MKERFDITEVMIGGIICEVYLIKLKSKYEKEYFVPKISRKNKTFF